MEIRKSSLQDLMNVRLPRLHSAMLDYRELAGPRCEGVTQQMLSELDRRLQQVTLLLHELDVLVQEQGALGEQALVVALTDEAQGYRLSEEAYQMLLRIWLQTEAFYLLTQKVQDVMTAKLRGYHGPHLPHLPAKLPHTVTADVLRYLRQHPFGATNSFRLNGAWVGPLLEDLANDGHGHAVKDPGLFANAAEWVDMVSATLTAANTAIRKDLARAALSAGR